MTWTTLISGIVGSQTYGLATADSDIDTLEVAAAPTREFLGLVPPTGKRASRVRTDPDVTTHEVGKFVSLCLSGNPTVNELLWLPPDSYREMHALAQGLLAMRRDLLSAQRVRDAYLGYATQQFKKMARRGDGTFSSETRNRVAKHARHLLRLTSQGMSVYLTGYMTVRLSHATAEQYREFGQICADDPEKGLQLAEAHLAVVDEAFRSKRSALTNEPDFAKANAWLVQTRKHLLGEVS